MEKNSLLMEKGGKEKERNKKEKRINKNSQLDIKSVHIFSGLKYNSRSRPNWLRKINILGSLTDFLTACEFRDVY